MQACYLKLVCTRWIIAPFICIASRADLEHLGSGVAVALATRVGWAAGHRSYRIQAAGTDGARGERGRVRRLVAGARPRGRGVPIATHAARQHWPGGQDAIGQEQLDGHPGVGRDRQ